MPQEALLDGYPGNRTANYVMHELQPMFQCGARTRTSKYSTNSSYTDKQVQYHKLDREIEGFTQPPQKKLSTEPGTYVPGIWRAGGRRRYPYPLPNRLDGDPDPRRSEEWHVAVGAWINDCQGPCLVFH